MTESFNSDWPANRIIILDTLNVAVSRHHRYHHCKLLWSIFNLDFPSSVIYCYQALMHQSSPILYALQNEALQQISGLFPFSGQIKLIFTRLFKVIIQWATRKTSLRQALCADRGWGIPALWLRALSGDLKTSLSSTQHIPTHISYLNVVQPHYVLNRSRIWQ